ncbi:hypothetical protein [Promicromonospora iranensis]|uniref:Ribosomally synthesized peptide with SipW-like signal peptide n=1 Tax=Promicromonospora iranensis TaxID=1105144 RepID=A0ABU2CM71_9MICO|nr:hypothetical protein [Promicromonospora iranensis]MDR7382439.1 hypothetical protein [Promicromonospora iranensis]
MKHARNDGPDLAFRLGRRVVTAVADDMSTTQRVVAGVVAALVAISPFGAWNEVEPQADPLTVGTPVEVGPFEVTVEKAATADELGHLVPAPGNHMLAVVAHVTNTGEVPEYSSTIGEAIPAPENVGIIPEAPLGEPGTVTEAAPGTGDAPDGADPAASPSPDEPGLPSASVVNIEDGTSIRILNPGLTYRVALIWEQSDTFSGDVIPLRIMALEWIEESAGSLDNEYWLLLDEVAFAGQIPVEPAKPAPDADAGAQ